MRCDQSLNSYRFLKMYLGGGIEIIKWGWGRGYNVLFSYPASRRGSFYRQGMFKDNL